MFVQFVRFSRQSRRRIFQFFYFWNNNILRNPSRSATFRSNVVSLYRDQRFSQMYSPRIVMFVSRYRFVYSNLRSFIQSVGVYSDLRNETLRDVQPFAQGAFELSQSCEQQNDALPSSMSFLNRDAIFSALSRYSISSFATCNARLT